jgi:Spy/CpxP family protein refolding chaperone
MKHPVRFLTLAAAVLAGGMVFNTQALDDPQAGRAPFLDRAKEKLGITDELVAKIKPAVAPEKEHVTDILRRLHSARAVLRETIQEPNASERSIHGAAVQLAAAEADAAVLRAKLHQGVSDVLTSGQVAQLKEMRRHAGTLVDRIIGRIGERLSEE